MGLKVSGARTPPTATGSPSPAFRVSSCGANRHLAWGITNSTVDTQDLCTLDSASGEERTWEIESTIVVRGGDDVTVRAAGGERHVEMDPPVEGDAERYGLFWSGLAPSTEIEGCQLMWRAKDYAEFRGALRGFGVPVSTSWWPAGTATSPSRRRAWSPNMRPGSGLAPAPFAEVARSWERFLEFDALPETVNPDEGYIVSANHKMVPSRSVSTGWRPTGRSASRS